jgi:hypothetical protein
LSRVGLDCCDILRISCNIPSNYGHALLWLGILCIGLREGYVGHHIIWWGYRCTTPPPMLALVALRNNLAEEGSHRKVAQHWVVHYPLVRRKIPPLRFFLFYFSLPGQGVPLPTKLPSLG